jgi:hypothetical protein
MSDENVVDSASLVNYSETDDSSSSSWAWLFVFIAIGIFMLVVYYFILYFYDATSLEDAVEKAIKRFNEDQSEEEWKRTHGNTGDTGNKNDSDEEEDDKDEVTFKKVLLKALDNSIEEGFSNYDADTSVGTIQKRGSLNWGFIEEDKNCSVSESEQCMSGDIFPTRDISINPKLRTQ